ncbi:hypothetical protein EON79_10375 [bacterium]|nr:MAG: hypothetical protein EON79_10375 [bacterium]
MVAERLTLDEMSRRYDGEWILIGDPELDSQGVPTSGIILAHSPDRDQVYDEGVRLMPRSSAIWSFVPWRDDVVYIF